MDNNELINNVKTTMSLDGIELENNDFEIISEYLNGTLTLEQSIQSIKDEISKL